MPKILLHNIIEGDDRPVLAPVSTSVISRTVYTPPPVEKEPEVISTINSRAEVRKIESPANIIYNRVETPEVKTDSVNNETNTNTEVTAFKNTIVGKILKGAAIAGGSILGLGAVVGVAKGVGVATGAVGALSATKNVLDKVGQSAVNLVTGTTKEERSQVAEVKAEAKAASDKLEQVDRLVKAGATLEKARAIVGVSNTELTTYDGEKVTSAGIGEIFIKYKQPLMIVGGLLAVFFLLPKIKKLTR